MAKNLCVKIEHPEVIEEFRKLVIEKHGQYIGYFGREIEAAMSYWIDMNRRSPGEKNNLSDERLRDTDTIKTNSRLFSSLK